MIIYAKTYNFVSHNFLGWLRCVKSSLNHLILKAHLQATPKVCKWQSGMGLMCWTYILRISKKTCGAYHTFFYLTFNFNKKLHTFTWDNKVFWKMHKSNKIHYVLFNFLCRFQICKQILDICDSFYFIR